MTPITGGSGRDPDDGPMSPGGRRKALETLGNEHLDLLVVGAGITGAGVARAATLHGMRVGLVEKDDFGAGTSSRSTKIVHGGVRYLETLQLGLVREAARERTALRTIAPHLVHPTPFLYPVHEGEALTKVRVGLRLFDFLAGARGPERSRRLDPEATRVRLPGLRAPLSGAVLYPEYVTDDARLTLLNVVDAGQCGAAVANHARVEALLREGGRVVGARVRDVEQDSLFEVRARATVNATGAWTGRLLASGDPADASTGPFVHSKGIHIVFPRSRLPLRAATFLRASSGRRGLAIPRGDRVYVGTSDEVYRGDLDRVRANAAEVEELLRMTRNCFPDADLGIADVRGRWAGVRTLVRQAGKSTREMARREEVWTPEAGLICVAGGKLTTYRRIARRVLREAAAFLEEAAPDAHRPIPRPLPGAPEEGMEAFASRVDRSLDGWDVSEAARSRLRFLYGTGIETLMAYGREDPDWMAPLAPDVPALRGEVRMAAEREMACSLVDVLDRRLSLLLFVDGGGSGPAADEASRILQRALGWDEARRERELEEYRALAREHGPLPDERHTPRR